MYLELNWCQLMGEIARCTLRMPIANNNYFHYTSRYIYGCKMVQWTMNNRHAHIWSRWLISYAIYEQRFWFDSVRLGSNRNGIFALWEAGNSISSRSSKGEQNRNSSWKFDKEQAISIYNETSSTRIRIDL